jgi:hypothetical protein
MSFSRALSIVVRTVLAVFVCAGIAAAQDKPQDKPQEKPQNKPQEEMKLKGPEMAQYEALNKLVDEVMTSKQPAPADAKLKVNPHFVKSTTNVFVPYVVEMTSGKFTSFPVALYVRAVSKGNTALSKTGDYPFSDVYFFNDAKLFRSTGADSAEFQRGMQLPAGEYDVYFALTETAQRNSKTPAKRVVHVHQLTVPDLSKELTTSSIILARSMEDAPPQMTAQQQLEQPFTIGGNKITPTFTPTFANSAELLFVFFIYNQGLAASGKPEVDVNYLFYRAAEEKPFSKAATTTFNATTLPAEFNSSLGHQLVVGQGIPLTSFKPGEYKLQISVADKTNSQTITRDVPFTVTQ